VPLKEFPAVEVTEIDWSNLAAYAAALAPKSASGAGHPSPDPVG
jgi:hypothetical protein